MWKHVDKLSKAQRIGLKYVDEFEKRIPRAEIRESESRIRRIIKNLDQKFIMTVCGSYRRRAATSGDIDILLTHPDYVAVDDDDDKTSEGGKMLGSVVAELVDHDIITDTLSQGDSKFMGVCRLSDDHLHRRLDIRIIPHNQYYCGVLYFTGSDMFNKVTSGYSD